MNKIPYDKTIWSTNYNEAVLTFHNDITVSFNQGDVKENDLNPYDSTSTPLFKLYYDSEITDLNSPDSAAFNHWPSYSKSVMPPMEMIKFIENDLVIVLSNIGNIFSSTPRQSQSIFTIFLLRKAPLVGHYFTITF